MSDPAVTRIAPKRRRFTLRFSLRTLMLGVLALGSGATLWWNWGPAEVAFRVDEPGEIQDVLYLRDDALVAITYWDSPERQTEFVDVRDATSGTRLRLIENPFPGGVASVTDNYVLFLKGERPYSDAALCRLDTGERLDKGTLLGADRLLFSQQVGEWLLLNYSNGSVGHESDLFHLPDCVRVKRVKGSSTLSKSGLLHYSADDSPRDEIHFDPVARTGTRSERLPLSSNLGEMFHSHSKSCSITRDSNVPTQPVTLHIQDVETRAILHFTATLPPMPFEMEFADDGDSFAVCTPGGSDVYRVDGSKATLVAHFNTAELHLISSAKLIADTRNGKVYDAETYQLKWERPDGWLWISPKAVLGEWYGERKIMCDGRTGMLLLDFSHPRWRDAGQAVAIGRSRAVFCAYGRRIDPALRNPIFFRLRRPIEWYGVAWLPEFWLAVLVCGGLMWSVWRDWKGVGTA